MKSESPISPGICEQCGSESSWRWKARYPSSDGLSEPKMLCRMCHRYFNLYRNYGITPEQHAELMNEQNGACAICGKPESIEDVSMNNKIGRLCVDHCHNSKQVRGLLCNSCNTVIGMANESADFLLKAADYIVNKKRISTDK